MMRLTEVSTSEVEEKDEFFVQFDFSGLENIGDPLACLSYVDGQQPSRCSAKS